MSGRRGKGRRRWVRWGVLALAAVALAALFVWALLPKPVEVEVARVTRGPMVVTVDEDGITRVRERFEVRAPVRGTLTQILDQPGTPVRQGQSVARIAPGASPLLDPRADRAARAEVRAARSALGQAQARLEAARATRDQGARDRDRMRRLHASGAVAAQDLEQAEAQQRVLEQEVIDAAQAIQVAQAELAAAQAALQDAPPPAAAPGDEVVVPAPATGTILRAHRENEGVVELGAPLVDIGALDDLEVVADILTQDAVNVSAGDPVLLRVGEGRPTLDGVVRLIEPAGFEYTSALGIEERRVNVIVDVDPEDLAGSALGDGYRVDVRIVLWRGDDVLQVPAGALFRHGEGWAVFRVLDETALLTPVEVGRRGGAVVQILAGLDPGQVVILFPSDRVEPGVAVRAVSGP